MIEEEVKNEEGFGVVFGSIENYRLGIVIGWWWTVIVIWNFVKN
jgi:hypothetical protein